MTDSGFMTAEDEAEFIAFEEFRDGLRLGRFHVIVNPELAPQFVAQHTHATAVAIALIGPGIAFALAGYPILGLLLVAAGILVRRVIKWQAPRILLEMASRQPAIFEDATSSGVMELRRA